MARRGGAWIGRAAAKWRGLAGRVVYPAILLIAALLLYREPLFKKAYAIPWDLPDYHGPLAASVAQAIQEHRLPLWDPYTYCGTPFHANIQAQIFYPPAWPFFALAAARGLSTVHGLLEWQVALHAFLAGWFAFGLARRLGLKERPALLAALLYECGGYFASQSSHLGAICAAAWMGLAWRAVVELKEGVTWRWGAALALALGLCGLAGFPAVAIVCGVTTVLLAALLWMNWRGWLAMAGAAVGAAALAAVQIWPMMELLPLSLASDRSAGGDPGGVIPEAFLSLLSPLLMPEREGYNSIFFYYYSGVALPALALAGLAGRGRQRWAMALMAGCCAVWMLGQNTPVGWPLWKALPEAVRSASYQEFAMPAFLLAACVLAGFGFERFWGEWTAGRKGWIAAAVVAAAVMDPLAANSKCKYLIQPAENYPRMDGSTFEGSEETLKALREAASGGSFPARFEIWRDSYRWYAYAGVLKAATPAGNDPLVLKAVIEVRRRYAPSAPHERYAEVAAADSEYLSRLNVGVMAARDGEGEGPPGWRLARKVHGHAFYLNPGRVWPRFYMSRDGSAPDEGAGTVEVERYENERVVLKAKAREAAMVVSSEAWYPGWRAEIDGREAKVEVVNGAFRGVRAPAGEHRVVMEYEAPRVRTGAGVSLGAAVLLIAALWRRAGGGGHNSSGKTVAL